MKDGGGCGILKSKIDDLLADTKWTKSKWTMPQFVAAIAIT